MHGGQLLTLFGSLAQGDGLLAEALLRKHLAGLQTQRHLVGADPSPLIHLGQQIPEIGIHPDPGEGIPLMAGQDVDVEGPVCHLAQGIAAIPPMGQLHGDEFGLQLGGGELALDDEQAVEKVMARLHPHRFGLDHRTQTQLAEAGQQLFHGLADMLGGVEIGSNAAEVKHGCHSLGWARLKYIRSSRLSDSL